MRKTFCDRCQEHILEPTLGNEITLHNRKVHLCNLCRKKVDEFIDKFMRMVLWMVL